MFIVLWLYSRIWNLVCINLRRPSGPHAIWPIQKLLNCYATRSVGASQFIPMGSNQIQCCDSALHQTSARWLKVTVSWMVSPCSTSCSWRPLNRRIRHSHLTYRQFHSLVPLLRPRRRRPQRTRLTQLENSTMGTGTIHYGNQSQGC